MNFLTMPDFECVGLRCCSHRQRDCGYGTGGGFSDVGGQQARSLRDSKLRNRDLARESIDCAKEKGSNGYCFDWIAEVIGSAFWETSLYPAYYDWDSCHDSSD